MNRIGIYLRVSTEEQAKIVEGSLVSQKQRLIEYIEVQNQRETNWGTLIDVYCDEAKSAKDMNRPEFQRLLGDVRLGRINLILATELSRFSRSIRDFCELWDLFKTHNTRFITLREQFDTTTAAGEMMVFNLINFAQFERKQTAERITANCLSRAKRGLWNGGRIPLGYERSKENKGVLVPNKEEVKKVKAVFKIFLETGSLRKTCLKLSEQAIFSKDGHHFTLSRLYNLLTNPAYISFRAVGRKTAKTELFKATWEGIIDSKTFERTQKILESNKSKYKPDEWKTYPYPLTEKIVCGECGKTMGGKSAYGKHRKHHYYEHTRKIKKDGLYHTKRCRIERVRAERIEKIILDYLKELLSKPEKIKEMVEVYSKHMNAEIPGFEGKIKTIQHDLRITQNKIENLIQRLSEIPKEISAEPIYKQLKALNGKEIILNDNLQNLELELKKASTKAIDIATLRNQMEQAVEAISKASIEDQRPIFANIINFAEIYPQKIRLGLYAPSAMRTGSCTVGISAAGGT